MRELSLHILDLVQNSLSANANLIEISIKEDTQNDIFEICITDNGCGMTSEFIKTVTDPFTTTRTTRKIGLGLSLLKFAAEQCDGEFFIESAIGVGTTVRAYFKHSHIDRAPLGDICETILSIVICNPNVDFIYIQSYEDKRFEMNTRVIKEILNGVKINSTDVVLWLKEYINEGISNLYGGVR